MNEEHDEALILTADEAYALLELLEDQAAEFVDNPYTPELAAIEKLRLLAGTPPHR